MLPRVVPCCCFCCCCQALACPLPRPSLPPSVQELELAAYLLHCERRLAEELDRCEAYLGLAMRKPLKEIVDSCLLEAHLAAILEGSRQLLAGCREQDLARLYG